MRISDVIEWLSAYDSETELGITVSFPELNGWEVTSWALNIDEDEGFPVLTVNVCGADFDYPNLEGVVK